MNKKSSTKESQKRLPNKKTRTATITFRTTPEKKAEIEKVAVECKMSKSYLIHLLLEGYEPKAAMTAEQEHKLEALIAARNDMKNYSNALNGMPRGTRTVLFGDEKFMYRWKTDLDKQRAAVNDVINSFTKPNSK